MNLDILLKSDERYVKGEMDKFLARAVLIKFLLENNCLREFVESRIWYKSKNPNTPYEASKVIDDCISTIVHRSYSFSNLFNSISSSFDWVQCSHIKPRDYWVDLNRKWRKIIPNFVYLK